jgi:hypothetical protein
VALAYLSLDDAEKLARRSERAAASERDAALAGWASGWVHAYRHEENAAVQRLGSVISYARQASDPWLEGSALQARGVARSDPLDAFADWERAVTRFVVSGDLTHANNVRYMLASRAVETGTRLGDVPVWLDGCESYASGRGLTHELAHIRRARAGYERIQGRPGTARHLLDAALPVFRQAGDFRCIARTLSDLADPACCDGPAVAKDLLVQALGVAAIVSGPAIQEHILAGLITAGGAVDDLTLAARCLGALDALGKPAEQMAAGRDGAPPPAPDLIRTLRGPGYATFVSEGRAGGIDLLTTLYSR